MVSREMVTSEWSKQTHQDRSQQTLERILQATQRLMATRPFRQISVAEIIREAKASVSSFYARFPDKEALLGCIYARHAKAQMALIDELLALERWRGVPLSHVLRQTFPLIAAGHRARQGLIRAFLEQASEDKRFRDTWGQLGNHVSQRVTELVMARRFEVAHPHPERATKVGLSMAFAVLAHESQMHRIDDPHIEWLIEEMIQMVLRYMGIEDVPLGTTDSGSAEPADNDSK